MHSWGPPTGSRPSRPTQSPDQRGQMENRCPEEGHAAVQLTDVLMLSQHLLPTKPFLTLHSLHGSQSYAFTPRVTDQQVESMPVTGTTCYLLGREGLGETESDHSDPYSNAPSQLSLQPLSQGHARNFQRTFFYSGSTPQLSSPASELDGQPNSKDAHSWVPPALITLE